MHLFFHIVTLLHRAIIIELFALIYLLRIRVDCCIDLVKTRMLNN